MVKIVVALFGFLPEQKVFLDEGFPPHPELTLLQVSIYHDENTSSICPPTEMQSITS